MGLLFSLNYSKIELKVVLPKKWPKKAKINNLLKVFKNNQIKEPGSWNFDRISWIQSKFRVAIKICWFNYSFLFFSARQPVKYGKLNFEDFKSQVLFSAHFGHPKMLWPSRYTANSHEKHNFGLDKFGH
jgi:hypothetical protein